MQEKMQVLGVELDNCSAKDAMKCVVEYLKEERMNVVEMVTMNTIARFQKEEEDEKIFRAFHLVLPSDKGILQAAGVEDERRLKEVDDLLFIKMVMRYLQKNQIRVFLLSETEDSRKKLEEYIEEEYSKLVIVDSMSLEGKGGSDDMILNYVNGAEVECILSTIPSPLEERFVYKNMSIINARLWLGFGPLVRELNREKKGWQRIKEVISRRILKKEVEMHKKKNDVVNSDSSK